MEKQSEKTSIQTPAPQVHSITPPRVSFFSGEEKKSSPLTLERMSQAVHEMYEAAQAELDRIAEEMISISVHYKNLERDALLPLEERRLALEKQFEVLSIAVGKPVKLRTQRRPRSETRIRTHVLWSDICKILDAGQKYAVRDIILTLVEQGYIDSPSTRSRVYAALSKWVKEGQLKKVSRGVYALADA